MRPSSSNAVRPFALGFLSCALAAALVGFRSGDEPGAAPLQATAADTATVREGEAFLRFDDRGNVVQVIRIRGEVMRICNWSQRIGEFTCRNYSI